MNGNEYININKVAEAKGLKSNRSLRLEINKPETLYLFETDRILAEENERYLKGVANGY